MLEDNYEIIHILPYIVFNYSFGYKTNIDIQALYKICDTMQIEITPAFLHKVKLYEQMTLEKQNNEGDNNGK